MIKWLALTLAFTAFVCAAQTFHFCQVTDTHLGRDLHFLRARKVVEAINQLPFEIEFVAVTGDMCEDNVTDAATMTRAITLFRELEPPVYFVPGNHDVEDTNLEETVDKYRCYFGPLSHAAIHRGVRFVFFYSEPIREGFQIEGCDPFGFIEEQLLEATSAEQPAVVLHHSPSVADFYLNEMHEGWKPADFKRWVELLNQHDVKAVLAGHFHRSEFYWLDDVPLYVAPPVAHYWQRQASFRIYKYDNGKLSYRSVYIEDAK